MFKRTTFTQERTYDAHDDARSSSQTPPPARPGPSRTRRYATQRARSKQPVGNNWQHEDDYSMDADDFPMPIQAVNTHQLLDRLLANAAVGITRGELGAANLHSSLLLIRTRLDSEAARAAEADARATSLLQRVHETMTDVTSARNELLATRESLHLHEVQLAQAQAEIQRAQRTIDALERARDDAEREAAEARTKARQAKLDHAVIVAREEGRRAGVEEGYRRGRTAGMHEGRQSARVNVRVADDSDYDTAEEELSPTRSTVNNSAISRGIHRPHSASSGRNRPRRASEPGVAPQPSTSTSTHTAAVLLRPLRKVSKEDQLPSPIPILVPATPPSPSLVSGRSVNHPPRPASAPIRSILRQPTPPLPDRQGMRSMSPDSRNGTSGTSSTPHPVDSSHETTQTSTSNDESTVPHLQRPVSRNQAYASENHLSSRDHHLLQPGRVGMIPETPNSLPPITPISIEATAPAIYSPFPLPHTASQQSHSVDRPPSIRSPPRATTPNAGKPVRSRGNNSGAVSYDPTFSPWSLLHSPTIPEAMRAPIVVNTMRPTPISAPLSEIDLVTRAPPAINAAPSNESQTAQPILRRLGTLRDLLEEPSIQVGSRRGTPTGEAQYSDERRSPLGPRPRQEADPRTRSPFDWLLRRSVRPSVRRAETSGTIPIEVHSPTETMTIPSQNRSPPGSHSQASPGFLSPEPQEQAQLWPPDPEALRAATVSAVSEPPILVNRPLVSDDNIRYAQGTYDTDEDSPSRLISPLEMGSSHGPLSFVPMRTGPDYFTSTLVRYPILRDSAQSPTQSDLGSEQSAYNGKRKRSSRSPMSRTEYAEAPIPAGLVYPNSGLRKSESHRRY